MIISTSVCDQSPMTKTTYTTQQIADHVGGELLGPGKVVIHGVEHLGAAVSNQISFIRNTRHAKKWPGCAASAVLVSANIELQPVSGKAVIRVDDADQALVMVLKLFAPPGPRLTAGVHPSATIDPSAHIAPDAAIGPGCVIGQGVRIGQGCKLHAKVTVLDETVLGLGCELFPGVVIYHRCQLEDHVVVHANAVIGADGFGYLPSPEGTSLVKVPQIGSVKIGHHVEIGAGSCIDRGKFSATTVGDGTKIDNLCQIGHNCQIGRHCILAGQVGLAGGVTVEDGAWLGGHAGVLEQLTIGAGAKLAAKALATRNVPAGETWQGNPASESYSALREVATLRRLPNLVKTLKKQLSYPISDEARTD